VYTVIRGQSFAGPSLADVATTGLMEAIGVQRRRGRDVATGVVLGAALGAAALFLYLGTLRTATTGASFTVLFGSIFVISPDTVPALIASGVIAILTVSLLARVLLLTSLSPDLARGRGVNVRLVGVVYLRGSTFAAHAIPNGARHRRARPQGQARRGDRADAGADARPRRPVREREQPGRRGDVLAAVRGGVRGQPG
jgi:ABC 3 transport family